MEIRNAKKSDFKEILKLQIELEKTECNFDSNLKSGCYETKQGKKELKKRIKDKKQVFLVAVSGENIIGFAHGRIMEEAIWYKESVGIFEHICVNKQNRRNGVAQTLLKKIEKELNNKGAKYIQILAFPQNKPAISLYNKNGYETYSVYLSKKL